MRDRTASPLAVALGLVGLVATPLAQAQAGLSLLSVSVDQPVLGGGDAGLAALYGKPADLEKQMLYASPAGQFLRGTARNVVASGSVVTLAPVAGGYATSGSFESPVMDLPAFSVLFVSYRADVPEGCSVVISVRTVEAGAPGDWVQVGREFELVLLALATQLQYRVDMTSAGQASPGVGELSLFPEAAPAAPTRSSPDSSSSSDSPSALAASPAPAPALSSPDSSCPPIVERDAWGAAPHGAWQTGSRPHTLIVHHTASPAASYRGAVSVRQVQSFHQDGNHWADIGYHFLIGPDGVVYRGRPENVVGAHAPPNDGRLGISMIANFENDEPTPAAFGALRQLVSHLTSKYGVAAGNLRAHRDVGQTACPGRNLYGRMDELRQPGGKAAD